MFKMFGARKQKMNNTVLLEPQRVMPIETPPVLEVAAPKTNTRNQLLLAALVAGGAGACFWAIRRKVKKFRENN